MDVIMMVDRSAWDQSFVDSSSSEQLASRQPTSTSDDEERFSSCALLRRLPSTAVWTTGNAAALQQQNRAAADTSTMTAFYQNGHVGVDTCRRFTATAAAISCSGVDVCRSAVNGCVAATTGVDSSSSSSSSSTSSTSAAELCRLSEMETAAAPVEFNAARRIPLADCCRLRQSTSSAQLLDVTQSAAVCRSSSSPNCFDGEVSFSSSSSGSSSGGSPSVGRRAPVSISSDLASHPRVAAVDAPTTSSHQMPSSSYSVVASFLPAWDVERLDEVYRRLSASGFYFGRMSVDEAARRLVRWPVGSFLLRDSSDSRYLFSVSVQTSRGTTSVRVAYRSGLFRLDCHPEQEHLMPTFDCALRLLRHYIGLCRRSGARSGSDCPPNATATTTPVSGPAGGHGYVLLETTGRRDTPVLLRTPYRSQPGSLMHLSRVAVNRALGHGKIATPSVDVDRLHLLPSLKDYMKSYPYDV